MIFREVADLRILLRPNISHPAKRFGMSPILSIEISRSCPKPHAVVRFLNPYDGKSTNEDPANPRLSVGWECLHDGGNE
jgi:hypothetical protein